MTTTVGVLREAAAAERRVALTPDGAARLAKQGLRVLVETGAGQRAFFDDDAYAAAGAAHGQSRAGVRRQRPTRLHPASGRDRIPARRRPAHRTARPAGRPCGCRPARRGEGDRGQPRPAAAHAQPRTGDGRAHLAGQRRRVQGRVGRGARRTAAIFPMLMTAAGTTRPAQVLVSAPAWPACRPSPPRAGSARW